MRRLRIKIEQSEIDKNCHRPQYCPMASAVEIALRRRLDFTPVVIADQSLVEVRSLSTGIPMLFYNHSKKSSDWIRMYDNEHIAVPAIFYLTQYKVTKGG